MLSIVVMSAVQTVAVELVLESIFRRLSDAAPAVIAIGIIHQAHLLALGNIPGILDAAAARPTSLCSHPPFWVPLSGLWWAYAVTPPIEIHAHRSAFDPLPIQCSYPAAVQFSRSGYSCRDHHIEKRRKLAPSSSRRTKVRPSWLNAPVCHVFVSC